MQHADHLSHPTEVNDGIRFEMERSAWEAAMNEHEARFETFVAPHVRRRSRHEKDPVADFLFEYYRFRPAHLQRWHPGTGILLIDADAERFPERDGYVQTARGRVQIPTAAVLGTNLDRFETGTKWMLSLLEATQGRPPRFGCFGLHEWAMLYRSDDQRHAEVSLRVSPETLASVVETAGLRCTHFDAFRFFTEKARPLNPKQLSHLDMVDFEQPGCLHANMDVYRWAFKRSPWVPSTLILDAFLLAMEIRHLDMASSPYDLRDQGIAAVRVETREGQDLFMQQQRAFSEQARPLRAALIDELRFLLQQLASLHAAFAIPRHAS